MLHDSEYYLWHVSEYEEMSLHSNGHGKERTIILTTRCKAMHIPMNDTRLAEIRYKCVSFIIIRRTFTD